MPPAAAASARMAVRVCQALGQTRRGFILLKSQVCPLRWFSFYPREETKAGRSLCLAQGHKRKAELSSVQQPRGPQLMPLPSRPSTQHQGLTVWPRPMRSMQPGRPFGLLCSHSSQARPFCVCLCRCPETARTWAGRWAMVWGSQHCVYKAPLALQPTAVCAGRESGQGMVPEISACKREGSPDAGPKGWAPDEVCIGPRPILFTPST